MSGRKLRVLLAVTIASGAAATAAAFAGGNASGLKTSQDPMITVLDPAKPTVPIITVGERMPGGYRFESIPDGIALHTRGAGRVDVYVNHETSTVPFPFNPPFGGDPPTEANQNDFDNAQLSHLILNRRSAGLLSAKYTIASKQNYQRFCSNYLATAKEGFDRSILFTNEEAQDWAFRRGTAWPGPSFIVPGTAGAEQLGATVAHDLRTGKSKTIYGMGRLNHENTVAVPVSEGLATLTTDDTFFTTQLAPPYKQSWSQLYSYMAEDTDSIWNDEGDLWAFVSDRAGYDDYFDFAPGDGTVIDGHFIRVPKQIATGKKADGTDLLSTDFPGMLAPPAVGGAPPDGPQWVLDQWGNAENNTYGQNVFRFVRLEDLAYDKRPEMSNVVYMADTGRASTGTPAQGLSTNGRIWKLEIDPDNPTENAKLSILVEGDDNPVAATDPALAFNEIHQPDSIESTANGSLLVTEDPSGNNNYTLPKDPNETAARVWRIDLNSAVPDISKVTAAEVDQAADEGPTDVDGTGAQAPPAIAPGRLGAWETGGITDASAAFGPGAFFVTIQAHTLWVQKADGPDRLAPAGKDFTFKREGGQLALIYLDPDW
jgi:hypothetical protein